MNKKLIRDGFVWVIFEDSKVTTLELLPLFLYNITHDRSVYLVELQDRTFHIVDFTGHVHIHDKYGCGGYSGERRVTRLGDEIIIKINPNKVD